MVMVVRLSMSVAVTMRMFVTMGMYGSVMTRIFMVVVVVRSQVDVKFNARDASFVTSPEVQMVIVQSQLG
jgi:hypothetical protein